MNHSGRAIAELLSQRREDIADCLIVHDDADLPIGEYKFSFGSGSGGQRGVEDIIQQFGSKDFWRLRVGVRDPRERRRRKAGSFVLKRIPLFTRKKYRCLAQAAFQELCASPEEKEDWACESSSALLSLFCFLCLDLKGEVTKVDEGALIFNVWER